MESQKTVDQTPPAPIDPSAPLDAASLRSLLERKTEELEKIDVGTWSNNVCGPI
jgi:hypothetical protein